MKMIAKIFFVCAFTRHHLLLMLLFTSGLHAQGLDPKKPVIVYPPDLQITGSGLLAASRDSDFNWHITLQVTIRNSSPLKAGASEVEILVKDPDQPGRWLQLATSSFPEISGRNAVYQEIEAQSNLQVLRNPKIKRLQLKIIADHNNKILETNERNNESAIIIVTSKER